MMQAANENWAEAGELVYENYTNFFLRRSSKVPSFCFLFFFYKPAEKIEARTPIDDCNRLLYLIDMGAPERLDWKLILVFLAEFWTVLMG